MIIDDALNMAYSYAATICQDSELCKVSQEFNGLAGETERTYITKSTTITSYSDIQNLLSKLNEKESVRKSKGVYYTPYDVVRFIVINSVKSAYGKLTPENIRREDIDAVPYKSFAAKKTVFDPTCGAGEYLLAALELKLDLLDKHYKRIPITVIHDTVTSIFGNDINTESIMITKLRIVLCILKRYGVDYIVGLAEKMRPNFLTYDYVVEEPGENKYDIIVGNPPYVEDFKSGLTLSKRYGNIYAIVPARCVDFRGMMECVLDALILNGILPHDVLMGSLLQNTSIAYIESLHAPFDKVAYIAEKSKANRFMYETVRGGWVSGTHAYFSLDSAVTGRYAAESDTEEYVVSYNDGRTDAEFIPLSGFRNHGFNPDSPELGVQHNTVNIMTAVHILLDKYYDLYKTNIALIMGTDTEYIDLCKLIDIEQQYLGAIKQTLKGRGSTAPKGDDNRLAFYGEKVKNLRLLWYGVGDEIDVDLGKFDSLVSGTTALTIDSYEDLYKLTGSTKKTIKIKGVLKMVDLKDYQKRISNHPTAMRLQRS